MTAETIKNVVEDKTNAVREGEELDQALIKSVLNDSLAGFNGELEVRQFPGGASNLTYLLKAGTKNGTDELVLRRPPFGTKPKGGHDMGREYNILNKLQGHFKQIPETLFYTDDNALMGCEFYIMRRLDGFIVRRDFPKGLEPDESSATRLSTNLVDTLIDLHNVDYEAANLADFGKPEGYVGRQVKGWVGRLEKALTEDVPKPTKLIRWILDNQPADFHQPAIIHGDFKFDNVVLDKQKRETIMGVLDWEMATLGDPLLDLGSTLLTYTVEADDCDELQLIRMGPTQLPGMLTRDEIVHRYCTQRGIELDDYRFYRVFGLFRLAVIVQQIYYRFYHKQTSNPKFAQFGVMADLLCKVAEREAFA